MIRNQATLKRWSSFASGTRLPDSLDELPLTDQYRLNEHDPQLYQLLAGTAPAELELAAMNGELEDAPMPIAERQAQERAAEVERLIAEGAFPSKGTYNEAGEYIPGNKGNLTAQLRIAQLDPQRYEAEKMAAFPPQPQPGALTEEGAAFVNDRIASMQAAGLGRAE